jgi:hypothetical protein
MDGLIPRAARLVRWRPVAIATLLTLAVALVLELGQANALAFTEGDAAYQVLQLRELLDEVRQVMWLPCH